MELEELKNEILDEANYTKNLRTAKTFGFTISNCQEEYWSKIIFTCI